METTTSNTEETELLATKLANVIAEGEIIFLYGDLGAGKTTFVRYLVKNLGSNSRVQSPSFVLHRTYNANRNSIKRIHHYDLYRINNLKDDIINQIAENSHDKQSITIVEWPNILESSKITPTLKIYFEEISENQRKILIYDKYKRL